MACFHGRIETVNRILAIEGVIEFLKTPTSGHYKALAKAFFWTYKMGHELMIQSLLKSEEVLRFLGWKQDDESSYLTMALNKTKSPECQKIIINAIARLEKINTDISIDDLTLEFSDMDIFGA